MKKLKKLNKNSGICAADRAWWVVEFEYDQGSEFYAAMMKMHAAFGPGHPYSVYSDARLAAKDITWFFRIRPETGSGADVFRIYLSTNEQVEYAYLAFG